MTYKFFINNKNVATIKGYCRQVSSFEAELDIRYPNRQVSFIETTLKTGKSVKCQYFYTDTFTGKIEQV